jgi:hypothetical protein
MASAQGQTTGMGGAKLVGLVLIMGGALAAQACKTACDPATIDRAVQFLRSQQSCEVDSDCVVVSDYCEELPGGFCGQLVMSREGAASAEWAALDKELRDCGPSECTVCDAAVVPACSSGSCNGP